MSKVAVESALREWLSQLDTQLMPSIAKATVPVFALSDDDRFIQNRTGVLLQISDRHFLLTASHGLRALVDQEYPLMISPSRRGEPPIHLLHSTFRCIDEHDVDVAVVTLDDDAVHALCPQRRFLRLNEIDPGAITTDGFYLIFGFPNDWSRFADGVVSSEPIPFLGRPYGGETNPNNETDPQIHLLLSYELNGVTLNDSVPVSLPAVNGMSGCGIWKVADWNSRAIRDWNPNMARLVAIQHSWDTDRNYVKATWLRHALGLIHEHYPDTQPALSMIY